MGTSKQLRDTDLAHWRLPRIN